MGKKMIWLVLRIIGCLVVISLAFDVYTSSVSGKNVLLSLKEGDRIKIRLSDEVPFFIEAYGNYYFKLQSKEGNVIFPVEDNGKSFFRSLTHEGKNSREWVVVSGKKVLVSISSNDGYVTVEKFQAKTMVKDILKSIFLLTIILLVFALFPSLMPGFLRKQDS